MSAISIHYLLFVFQQDSVGTGQLMPHTILPEVQLQNVAEDFSKSPPAGVKLKIPAHTVHALLWAEQQGSKEVTAPKSGWPFGCYHVA